MRFLLLSTLLATTLSYGPEKASKDPADIQRSVDAVFMDYDNIDIIARVSKVYKTVQANNIPEICAHQHEITALETELSAEITSLSRNLKTLESLVSNLNYGGFEFLKKHYAAQVVSYIVHRENTPHENYNTYINLSTMAEFFRGVDLDSEFEGDEEGLYIRMAVVLETYRGVDAKKIEGFGMLRTEVFGRIRDIWKSC